ncbi:MOSC domain-containing protein [Marivita sp. GX14005]|uniref:MOSC domain-containing protein n=1 Tax=Marivita sp. GX14005 TaxID=2942276 RepID=UPI0020198D02|nr:MOSC domain-containing protein [Marivita sp. GX14005]MCL3883106.1 MOSC domain-containing protein [Marivita sp. GX14005]
MTPHVIAVARDDTHRFSKVPAEEITLLKGLGVEGDAHCGETVKHRSRVKADPTQPNLRQVHLYQAELFDEYAEKGFTVGPADLGENITTRGIDLLALPKGAVLELGREARVEITGLRNPCAQIDAFQPGLLSAFICRDANGKLMRRTGVMGIVLASGKVRPDDPIVVHLPEGEHRALERV